MKHFLIIAILVGTVAIGCKSKKVDNKPEPVATTTQDIITKPVVEGGLEVSTDDSLFASIQRTACFGRCPVYRMEIFDNGYITYKGKHFVDSIGLFSGKVEANVLDSIKLKAIAIEYFDLENKYPSAIADFPSTTTSVKINGRRKEVYNKQNAPQKLRAFEKYIEDLTKDVKWTRLPEPKDK